MKKCTLFLLVLMLVLPACTFNDPSPARTPFPTFTTPLSATLPSHQETPSASPTALPGFMDCVPSTTLSQHGEVVKIIDGDTINVKLDDGQVYKVRYIGMDTPERGDPFYNEATDANAALVDGQEVWLIKDVSETDRYDRLLRYVFAGDSFVNYALVRQGFAVPLTYPPDVACADTFVEAERQARDEGVGLWKNP